MPEEPKEAERLLESSRPVDAALVGSERGGIAPSESPPEDQSSPDVALIDVHVIEVDDADVAHEVDVADEIDVADEVDVADDDEAQLASDAPPPRIDGDVDGRAEAHPAVAGEGLRRSPPLIVVDAGHAEARRPLASGPSLLPPAPAEVIDAIAAAVARLRAEAEATTDADRRARLLHAAAEVQERGGDEQGAARDHLAAYNSDTTFREPLEALVRLLERRRSLTNLGKLIETLVAAAASPEERARALTQRALFAQDVQDDLEGARGFAREATETGAGAADLGPAWLALEMVAAKLGDGQARAEALAGRAALTAEPTWRGLLLVDVADLEAEAGETDRALDLLARVRREGGAAAFLSTGVAERIARRDPGLAGSDDARARGDALADALEARADMILDALGDADRGDRAGVPRAMRQLERAIDLLLLAADARRLAGDLAGAAPILDRAIALVGDAKASSSGGAGPSTETLSAIERAAVDARMRLAESAGEAALAATLAAQRLATEGDDGIAAALAFRIAKHAASDGDLPSALEALSRALERDPGSAPARALRLDIFDASKDDAGFATELEELSRQCTVGEAQGRALLFAAYVWATRVGDAARARAALGQAEACGVPKDAIARLGRSFASACSDHAWYEDATRSLIEHIGSPSSDAASSELVALWAELARLCFARGDAPGAAQATEALRATPGGAWLGRVLHAFAGSGADPARARSALEELASEVDDPSVRYSLGVVSALRARAAGDEEAALRHLETLTEDEPADPLVSAVLGASLRRRGDHAGATERASAAAEAALSAGDVELSGARHLEAGFGRWRLGDRGGARSAFEAAVELTPRAAGPALAWASRGIDVDGVTGRRAALELAEHDAATSLERFALEASLGDPDEAGPALAAADRAPSPGLTMAAALARLSWPRAAEDPEALAHALEALGEASEATRKAAAAERFRLTREDPGVAPDSVVREARAWVEAGGGAPAAVEWLAGALASGEPEAEIPARRALAELLQDEAREALDASATLLAWALDPEAPRERVQGSSHAVKLANLELSPPGRDPRRRAEALAQIDGALGEEAEIDALGLAGWSMLTAGDAASALEMFRSAATRRPDALHIWEGMRAAAEHLADGESYAVACEQLGARCADDARGAAFWEQAGIAWLEIGREERGEAALGASFARDATRSVAFDRLFRRVRDRKDGDELLNIIRRRLHVTRDDAEIAKLYWEQARVLREKGDPDGALEALEHVTSYDQDHVGALALTGEIFIRRGMFAEAAKKLARLARVEAAPPKNRVTAGVAAVDLYENKLGRHDLALEVLVGLHRAQLTTLPVRERLARAAARTGQWEEATRILEELMRERPEREGRIEAARLAMVIHKDRLSSPTAALVPAAKILQEAPTDGEALDLVLLHGGSLPEPRALLERGRDALLLELHTSPSDLAASRLLARVAHKLGDDALEQAALSAAVALGGPNDASERRIAQLSNQKPRAPQVVLPPALIARISAPGDDGPVAELFAALGPTLGEALGPTREALGVTRKDRVDARSGLALRAEIAQWAGAFGLPSFELYIGGKDPLAIQGVAGSTPALVVGSDVTAPLSQAARARLARELIALVRGTTVTRWRDDTTVAAIVVATCKLTKVPIDAPPYAVLAEVERLIGKAMSRKTRALVEPICRAYVASGADARAWAPRARSTQARAAVLASGDVSVALADVFDEPVERLAAAARDDLRAHELLRFVLSRPYFELRRSLGLETER